MDNNKQLWKSVYLKPMADPKFYAWRLSTVMYRNKNKTYPSPPKQQLSKNKKKFGLKLDNQIFTWKKYI